MFSYKSINNLLLVIALGVISIMPVFGCLEVMVTDGKNNYAGNNEDYWNFNTKIWYYPATDKEYGRVCLGYDEIYGFVQGGMNDQGLFIDGNALDPIDSWTVDEAKPFFPDSLEVCGYVLAHCATVDEAVAIFEKYNLTTLRYARIPIADAKGQSAIIEWGRGKLQIVRRTGKYQIATNFVQSDYDKMSDYPCERYFIADKILSSKVKMNIDTVRRVLSATHQEGYVNTLYSNICDLNNKKMVLYQFHNFEEPVIIDLKEELKKGKHGSDISTLFFVTPFSEENVKKSIPLPGFNYLKEFLDKNGLDSTLVEYEKLKNEYVVKRHKVDLSEEEINNLGYEMLKQNRYKEAIALFQLNVKDYPKSWNAYDSLAEAYMKNGQNDLAIENYEKSLNLNPNSYAGKKALEILKKK